MKFDGPNIVLKRMKTDMNEEKPNIIICHSGFRVQQAYERMRNAGYRNLALLQGGTEALLIDPVEANAPQYVQLIDEMDLKPDNPKLMDIALPANRNSGLRSVA